MLSAAGVWSFARATACVVPACCLSDAGAAQVTPPPSPAAAFAPNGSRPRPA